MLNYASLFLQTSTQSDAWYDVWGPPLVGALGTAAVSALAVLWATAKVERELLKRQNALDGDRDAAVERRRRRWDAREQLLPPIREALSFDRESERDPDAQEKRTRNLQAVQTSPFSVWLPAPLQEALRDYVTAWVNLTIELDDFKESSAAAVDSLGEQQMLQLLAYHRSEGWEGVPELPAAEAMLRNVTHRSFFGGPERPITHPPNRDFLEDALGHVNAEDFATVCGAADRVGVAERALRHARTRLFAEWEKATNDDTLE